MKIYLLGSNHHNAESPFARASAECAWTPGALCPVCERTTTVQIAPVTLVWQPGSELIPDFLFGLFFCVVQSSVRGFFRKNGYEFEYGKVLHKRSREPLRGRKIVPFPYTGPKFYWVVPVRYLWPNIEKSGMTVRRWCGRCGRLYYCWGEQIIIDRSAWNNEKVFSVVYKGDDIIYATEQAVEEILAQRYEGFSYELAGRIE